MSGPLPTLPGPFQGCPLSHRKCPTASSLIPNQRTPEDTCVPVFHCHLWAPGQRHLQHTSWGHPSKHSACSRVSSQACPRSLPHMQTSSVLGPSRPSSHPLPPVAWFPVTLPPCALQVVSPKGPRITPGSSVVKIHPEPSPIPGTLPHPTHLLPLQPCSL